MPKPMILRALRSKAFQLALQTTIISGLGAVIISAVIYYAAETTIKGQLDSAVKSEQAEIMSDSSGTEADIEASIHDELNDSSGLFYALLGPSGKLLVGNVDVSGALIKKLNVYKTLTVRNGLNLPAHVSAIRGMAIKLDNGDVLYIAEKANELMALNEFYSYSFLILVGGILVIGMAGGFFAARSALRRVEAITSASQEIMAGNLARRIDEDGSGDEFDRLIISLNMMLDRIQVLMQNVQQVSNDISHDLRSPLARLRDSLEDSKLMTPDPATGACFDEAIEQVDSVLGIFSAMLRLAEIETQSMRTHFLSVDMAPLVEDMGETFKVVAAADHKIIHTQVEAPLCVTGDRELLEQMLVNVIENAILYSPPGKDIVIRAWLNTAGGVAIEIADRGPGIPVSEHKRVLQRFVRLDASRHNPGTGLGLALVAAIADLHGAAISFADNHPGLRVLFQFPTTNTAIRDTTCKA
ncbi:MAG: hypothetical protein B7Y73_08225 [Acidocella sp. 35-58-6]|nr:MAG: hypothetical protein B7Y73_08225 [Acidocella sp. 35-58-6]